MKFLVLLFVAFANTYVGTEIFNNTGVYNYCIESDSISGVQLYAGNSFIDATLLPNKCYIISIGVYDAIITGENTNLMIQNGIIISLITNGKILRYTDELAITYFGKVTVSYTYTAISPMSMVLIIIALFTSPILLLCIGAMIANNTVCCTEVRNTPETQPLIAASNL
jgi:hypothetical protein